jgi:hypothetical protein
VVEWRTADTGALRGEGVEKTNYELTSLGSFG